MTISTGLILQTSSAERGNEKERVPVPAHRPLEDTIYAWGHITPKMGDCKTDGLRLQMIWTQKPHARAGARTGNSN